MYYTSDMIQYIVGGLPSTVINVNFLSSLLIIWSHALLCLLYQYPNPLRPVEVSIMRLLPCDAALFSF